MHSYDNDSGNHHASWREAAEAIGEIKSAMPLFGSTGTHHAHVINFLGGNSVVLLRSGDGTWQALRGEKGGWNLQPSAN